MEKHLNHIDNLFKEGLSGYAETPPPFVWDALEERLDNDKKKRGGFFFRRRWVMLVLALVSTLGSIFAWRMTGENGESLTALRGSNEGTNTIAQETSNTTGGTNNPTDGSTVAATATTTQNTVAPIAEPVFASDNSTANDAPVKNNKQITTAATTASESVATTLPSQQKPTGSNTTKNVAVPDMDGAIAMAENNNDNNLNNIPGPAPKAQVIGYIVKTKTRNNIEIAESEPIFGSASSQTNELLSEPDFGEEEVTFGKKTTSGTAANPSKKATETKHVYASAAQHKKHNINKAVVQQTITANTTVKHSSNHANVTHNEAIAANTQQTKNTTVPTTSVADNHTSSAKPVIATTAVTTSVKHDNAVATTTKETTRNNSAAVTKTTVPATTANVPATKTTISTSVNNVTKESNTATAGITKKQHIKHNTTTVKQPSTVATEAIAKVKSTEKTTIKPVLAAAITTKPVVAIKKSNATQQTEIAGIAPKSSHKIKANAKQLLASNNVVKNNATPVKTAQSVTSQEKPVVVPNAANTTKAKATSVTAAVKPTPIAKQNSKTVEVAKIETATATKTKAVIKSKATQKEVTEEELASATTNSAAQTHKTAAHKKNTPATSTAGNTAAKTSKNTPPASPSAGNKQTTATSLAAKPNNLQPVATNVLASAPAVTTPVLAKIPGTFKSDTAAFTMKPRSTDTVTAAANSTAAANDSNKHKKGFMGFEVGVKGGYEGGVTEGAARKVVIAPFLERKLNSKMSLMVQPALKMSSVGNRGIGGSQSFYRIVDSSVVNNGSYSITLNVGTGGTVNDTVIRTNYLYSQTRDSIAKTYSIGSRYLEVELPLLLKYSITDKLSVYGGISLNYSKSIRIIETTTVSGDVISSKFVPKYTRPNTAATPDPISSVIQPTGNDISTYKGPLYPASQGNIFRLGYMLGVSYDINKRYMIDLLIQQGNVKANVQGGYNVNKALSSTYFRFTVGYRLFK